MTVLEESLARPPIAAGKTKRIFEKISDPDNVFLIAKDDITAGDGAKHDIIEGKAMYANKTTCNVFRALKAAGIPVAFKEQVSDYGFEAPKCAMLPYEVVVRREAHGSYLKRAPSVGKGFRFEKLLVEFFLKTSGRKWKEYDLICDDPLMIYCADCKTISLFDPTRPNLPLAPAEAFLTLRPYEVFSRSNEDSILEMMGELAQKTFIILEDKWQHLGKKLVDFKVEFGISPYGTILLADVIDNDSWRILDSTGGYMDKQVYRDGGALDVVTKTYQRVAELTNNFKT